MRSTQEIYYSESYCLAKNILNRLSWSERERLKQEIDAKQVSEQRINQTPQTILTNRECQVLTLVANGYTRKEVGDALKISHNTASTHISHIYEKLEISTIAEATHAALRLGIL